MGRYYEYQPKVGGEQEHGSTQLYVCGLIAYGSIWQRLRETELSTI